MSTTLKHRAYEQIRTNLMGGKLVAGHLLATGSLAQEMGISQTPIREAIIQLESEGFVEQVPRLGYLVKKVDRGELVELFELRQFLEQGAAVAASTKITDAQVVGLRELCQQLRKALHTWRNATDAKVIAALVDRMVAADAAFHLRLLMAAGNRRVIKLVSDMQLMAVLFRRHLEIPESLALSRWAHAYREHCQIVRALADRDPQATMEATARHLERAKAFYLHAYDNCRRNAPAGTDPDRAWSSLLMPSLTNLTDESPLARAL